MFKRSLAVAASFVGIVVGAGFASGMEALQYFVAYGTNGFYGVILASVTMLFAATAFMSFGSYFLASEHNEVFYNVTSKPAAFIMDWSAVACMFSVGFVMFAGAGSNLRQSFDWPIWIGATLMHRGEIYRGAFGTAPEFGHITVVPGGRACSCGKQGCLERYASGTSLVDCAIDIATKGSFKDSGVYRAVVEKRASGHDIMAAARDGDQLGLAALESFSTWLGRGLAIVADVLDPAQIVLGGGVSEDADLFLLSAQRSMEANIVGAGYRPLPEILCAELGSRAGMIGVADLARELL